MNIAVIGSNPISTGISHVAALDGHRVALYDVNLDAAKRNKSRLERTFDQMVTIGTLDAEQAKTAREALLPTDDLNNCAQAEFIIELSPESLEVKQALIEKLDGMTTDRVILAIHTDTLSVTTIAAAARRHPERVVGMHFFHPVPETPLVEIVRADQSTQTSIDQAVLIARRMGKDPILVRDAPGFVVNRINSVYTREALHMLGEGHVDAETIDRLMESAGFKEAPFRLMDNTGIDQHHRITEQLYEANNQEQRYRPHPILRKMVQSRRLGKKTKQGFYSYHE
jgi:3-hydroxybutyryl-CoA dehydrogenase